jgi:cytochrome bd-type quinol oxidase subunit 1
MPKILREQACVTQISRAAHRTLKTRPVRAAILGSMPDRFPSLIVLLAFWIPPAVAGWGSQLRQRRQARPGRTSAIYGALAAFVLVYAAAWFSFNLGRMPPYIPGATMDPTVATPDATAGLAVFTAALILPGSVLACVLAFRRRAKRF